MNFIRNQIIYLFWSIKEILKIILNNTRSVNTIYKNYFVLVIITILAIPWLSGNLLISLVADLISFFAFLILLQDKIQVEGQIFENKKKILAEIKAEITDIRIYLRSIGIATSTANDETISNIVVEGLNDYNYFDDHRYKYLIIITEKILGELKYSEPSIYCLKYEIFSNLKTKYRTIYINDFIVISNIEIDGTLENMLLKYLAYRNSSRNKMFSEGYQKYIGSIEKVLLIEFGDRINQIKIRKILSDKERAEKFREVITRGIEQGLISEKGLESITRNKNKLFVIIKYGEGTGKKDWPKKLAAPFARVLKKHYFEVPFYQDRFTFIRDLNENPINTTISEYVELMLAELARDYEEIKKNKKYRSVQTIQDGPHYELLGFIADKNNFIWKLSRYRSFNSFINDLILNEALASDYSTDFIQANFYKIREIIENMNWLSLISNNKLQELISKNIQRLGRSLDKLNIHIESLFDIVALKRNSIEILENEIYKIVKGKNISKRKKKTSESEKKKVITTQITALIREATLFTNIIRDLEK